MNPAARPHHVPRSSRSSRSPAGRRSLAVGLSAVLLAVAACGDGDDDGGGAGGDEHTATTTPDATSPDATSSDPDPAPAPDPGSTGEVGELLTSSDLPDGFDLFPGDPLFADEPLCVGDAPPAPALTGVSGTGFTTEDFSVLVAADGIVTAGEAADYAAWILGELERCDGVDGAEYAVEQVADSTWQITTSVDFGDGSELLSVSWMTASSADAVAVVHLLDGGLSDIDGLELLGTVAARLG